MAVRNNKSNGSNREAADSFRRPSRRVAVRKAVWWKRALRGMLRGSFVLMQVGLAGAVVWLGFVFARDSGMFRLQSAESIEIVGRTHVESEAVRERFSADVGKSLFWLPLGERRRAVEEIPWVRTAAVERLLPGGVRVVVKEREPVAYLRQGSALWLVDSEGVLLPIPEESEYDFPVITGVPESFSREQRAVRVKLVQAVLEEMDSGGVTQSARFSEIDVGDLDNVNAVVAGPGGTLRVYFGQGRYLEKFQTFLEHRQLWSNRREPVDAVDLRYRGQIVLNPDRSRMETP